MRNPFTTDERSFQRRQTALELIGSAAGDAAVVSLFHDIWSEWSSRGVFELVPSREDAGVSGVAPSDVRIALRRGREALE
jgi:hypothetical protein